MALTIQELEIGSNSIMCGEIYASVFEDRNEFYLHCYFCECKYLQINSFIQHIYDGHLVELPSRFFKEYSHTVLDANGLTDVDDNIEDSLESLEARKHMDDTNLVSRNFETVLLAPEDMEIKEELQLDMKDMHIDQTETKNSTDVPSDDDQMVSDFEIAPKRKNLLRKKVQTKPKPRARNIKITDAIINADQCIILAEIYKKHTCLWDEKDIAYRFNNKRDKAMASIREEFNNKTGLNLTEYDFEREVLRIRKICSYEKKQKIICKQEKTTHKPSCTFYNYIKFLEVDVSPFVCSICGKHERVLGRLKVHQANHDGSLPFKCHICERGFTIGVNLTRHLRRHEQDRRFKCELCEKAFVTFPEVELHMRRHNGEKRYVCYVCGKKQISSSALTDHIKRIHEKDRRFKCDICSKGFCTPKTLREHKNMHNKALDYVCETCKKGFKSRKLLTQHSRTHDIVKRYICKICGKRFAQCAGLCGHMKSHGTIPITNSIDNQIKNNL